MATVTLNGGANKLALPLTVTLSSSNMSEATVPASVVIPAGSTSTSFAITVPSGATAGPVTISAEAAGANMGAATVAIATGNHPCRYHRGNLRARGFGSPAQHLYQPDRRAARHQQHRSVHSGVSNGTFTVTPLVISIPALPAQSEYPIPVEVTATAGETVEQYLDSSDCCNLPGVDISYFYQAADPVEQTRQVRIDPVFVTASHYAAIQGDWGSNSPSFSSLSSDLFNSPNPAFIEQVQTDATNSQTTDQEGNLIGSDLPTLEQQLLAALANGLTGSVSQIAADASNLLSGICNLTNNPPVSTTGGSSGGGGTVTVIDNGTPVVVTPTFTPWTWNIPTSPTVTTPLRSIRV